MSDIVLAAIQETARRAQADLADARKVIAKLERERDAGKAFKDFVHKRLDRAGVPTHPDGPHSKEGCRVGDRLDILQRERDEAESRLPSDVSWLFEQLLGTDLVDHEPYKEVLTKWRTDTTLRENIAKLERERDEANARIQAMGGYHARTGREVEIQTALDETPPSERDTHDVAIGELLALVDAGRNRVWKAEEESATLRARIAQLESQIAMKDGALRVIANGEIVLPGGTPVEIAREALKGSAK